MEKEEREEGEEQSESGESEGEGVSPVAVDLLPSCWPAWVVCHNTYNLWKAGESPPSIVAPAPQVELAIKRLRSWAAVQVQRAREPAVGISPLPSAHELRGAPRFVPTPATLALAERLRAGGAGAAARA